MKSLNKIINNSQRLTFTFTKYQEKERLFIEKTLEQYLESIGMEEISNKLCFCLHEQASNACKANSKRVYFIEQQLDITNPTQYQSGIQKFKDNIVKKREHYFALREKRNLFIKFQIKRDHEYLYISIINNVPLTPEESQKIQHKFQLSEQYDNMLDAIDDLTDVQEGAGLGIFTILMMFKEMGIKKEDVNIFNTRSETHATTKIHYI